MIAEEHPPLNLLMILGPESIRTCESAELTITLLSSPGQNWITEEIILFTHWNTGEIISYFKFVKDEVVLKLIPEIQLFSCQQVSSFLLGIFDYSIADDYLNHKHTNMSPSYDIETLLISDKLWWKP